MALTDDALSETTDAGVFRGARDLYYLGYSRNQAGDKAGALIAFRKAAESSDDKWYQAYACVCVASELLKRNELEEAVALSWRAATNAPDESQLIHFHAHLLRLAGNADESIRYCKAIITAEPDNNQHLWTFVALMLVGKGRYLEALDVVRAHGGKYAPTSLEYKTMLEVSDICLAAYEHPAAPITSAFNCPTTAQACAQWQALFEDCPAFRRRAPVICVGDSHAAFFSGAHSFQFTWPEPSPQLLPHVSGFYIASALAYSLNRRETSAQGLEKLENFLRDKTLVKGSTLMLSFGEIDLRNHVIAQSRDQGRPVEAIVADCAIAYRHAVELVLTAGFRTMIWAPPPSRADEAPYPYMFPTVGTEVERNAATRSMIQALRATMIPLGVPVISIFDEIVGADLRSDGRYFMDSCHLNMAATPHAIAAMRRGLEAMQE
jgi:tetratricopeptide (TPR) repeat protein